MRFPNLSSIVFPFKKKRNDSEVEYASFSTRIFAMTLDLLLLTLVFDSLFYYISYHLNTEFYDQNGPVKIEQLSQLFVQQKIIFSEFTRTLSDMGYFAKVLKDYLVQIFICGVVVLLFWQNFGATPAMMLFRLRILDAETGEIPSFKRYVIRYIGSALAIAPLMAGMLPILFNHQNRALQDFMAGTVMVRKKWKFEIEKPKKSDSEEDDDRLEISSSEPEEISEKLPNKDEKINKD